MQWLERSSDFERWGATRSGWLTCCSVPNGALQSFCQSAHFSVWHNFKIRVLFITIPWFCQVCWVLQVIGGGTCAHVGAFVRPSVHPRMRTYIRACIHKSINPSLPPSVCPSIHASIHASIHPPMFKGRLAAATWFLFRRGGAKSLLAFAGGVLARVLDWSASEQRH